MSPIASRRAQRGFTLTEILIVVAMVGILASIAYPSYRGYIQRANRADAQQVLMQAAQAAERWFAATNSYATFATARADGTKPSDPYSKSPESGAAVYEIVPTVTSTTFQFTATPVTTGPNAKDGCLRIDNLGRKEWTGVRTATGCGTTYAKTWADRN